jgi:membrane protein DedA with SNARE-associated domain
VLDDMTGWVEDVINALGYAGVAFLVALENLFPPIPSEIVLPLAGFVAGRGEANLVGMMVAATVGSTVGALVLYGIAAAIGPDRIHAFIVRYGRWFTIKEADLVRAEEWFDRRSDVAVLVGRCVPIIRSIVSIPAGFRRMPLVRFTVLTIIGSSVWNVALVGAGAALGENWEDVGDWVGLFQIAVVVVIALLVLWFVFARFIRPRLTASGALPADMEDIDADGDGFADR